MGLGEILRLTLGIVALAAIGGSTVHAQTAVRIESGALVLPSAVRFEAGTDVLADGSETGLMQVAQFLTEKDSITLLRVETNAAVLDSSEANLALGKARAQRLAEWFRSHGADCKRLIYVTHGQDKPMVAGKGEPNERVEFYPAMLRGRPIGGMPVEGSGRVVQAPCP